MGPGFAVSAAAMLLALSTATAATASTTTTILRRVARATSRRALVAFASPSPRGPATIGRAPTSWIRRRDDGVVRLFASSRPPPPPEYSLGDDDDSNDDRGSRDTGRPRRRGPIKAGRRKVGRPSGTAGRGQVDGSSSWMDRNARFESRPSSDFDDHRQRGGDRVDVDAGGDDDADGDDVGFGDDFRGTRVFVQNIPPDVTWKELKDHFRTAGEVVFANISVNPDDGKSKGCGVVQYETVGEARRAIEIMGDHPLGGANLFVREDRQERDRRRRDCGDASGWGRRMGGGGGARSSKRSDRTTDGTDDWTCADESEAGEVLSAEDREMVIAIVRARGAARRRRDYDASDSMREELKSRFRVHVDDRRKLWWTSVDGGRTVPAGLTRIKGEGRWGERKTPWRQIPTTPDNDACVDPDVVNELLKLRDIARMEKDFTNADELLEEARTSPEGDLYLRIHDESRTWRIWTDEPPPRRVRNTPSEPLSVNNQCLELVRAHDPGKVDEIRNLLEKFPGREYNILKKLKQRYSQ